MQQEKEQQNRRAIGRAAAKPIDDAESSAVEVEGQVQRASAQCREHAQLGILAESPQP